jgi:hypothetical protein
MMVAAINPVIPAGWRSVAMAQKLHQNVSLQEANWDSIEKLLDEADMWSRPDGGLRGLSDDRIESEWGRICSDPEVPPQLREFLRRAGESAPFINSEFEESYCPAYYQDNRGFAYRFLKDFSSSDVSTVLHRLGEDGNPSSVVVIACNVGRGDYYCIDTSANDSTVFWVHDDHGELKEETMTMYELLRLQLLNYWFKNASRGG